MKNLIKKILKEETTNRFIEKVANYIKIPYFKNMEGIGVSEDEYPLVLSKVFNQPVRIEGNYDQRESIVKNKIYNTNGNIIYLEESNGYWYKREYDTNGNKISYEDSDGYWTKTEYDSNGNEIYSEDSDGTIIDKR